MEILFTIGLGSMGLALIAFSLTPFKFTFNKTMPPTHSAIGVKHGMVRRKDRNGVMPTRSHIQ